MSTRTVSVPFDIDTFLDATAPTTARGGDTAMTLGHITGVGGLRPAFQIGNLYSLSQYFTASSRVVSAQMRTRFSSPTYVDIASKLVDVEMIDSGKTITNDATWDVYQTGLSWLSAGGDVQAVIVENFSFTTPASAPSAGDELIIPGFGLMVQKALSEQAGLLGFRMKLQDESGVRIATFASNEHATYDPPMLEAVLALSGSTTIEIGGWEGRLGGGSPFTSGFLSGFRGKEL